MTNILLLGFGPFLSIDRNPSWEAIKLLETNYLDVNIIKKELPVSFKRVKNELERIISRENPNVILITGVQFLFNCFVLTASAINIMYSELPDVDNYTPNWEKIYENAPDAYIAKVPLTIIQEKLRKNGIPAFIAASSIDFYVCNATYYIALHLTRNSNTKVCFVHIPMASEFCLNSVKTPNLPLNMIKRGIEIILEILLEV